MRLAEFRRLHPPKNVVLEFGNGNGSGPHWVKASGEIPYKFEVTVFRPTIEDCLRDVHLTVARIERDQLPGSPQHVIPMRDRILHEVDIRMAMRQTR